MRRVGLSFATANARQQVKKLASATTDAIGGSGAVREVIEFLLEAQGIWDEILKKYEVTA
jgi:3-deoxy-D-manno-octulosonate 8-phosphate phosphatase (KDO 8-P phosphatase)